MQTPTHFTILPGQEGGYVYSTNFILETTLPTAYRRIVWSLGDGTVIYDKRKINHVYNYPGIYEITLEAWTRDGNYIKDEASISVDYILRDSIRFSKIPKSSSMPGLSTSEPFEVTFFSTRLEETINLVFQSLNSRSKPYDAVENEKWRFLIPKWYFVEAETGKRIKDFQTIKTSPVYYENTKIGVSGTCKFYYIDETSTITAVETSPVKLIVTVDTTNFVYPTESLRYPYYSYSNNQSVYTSLNWHVNACFPTNLRVTENFINDVFPTKWTNVPIPVMVTCRFAR
jgi:hypothetical protein